MSRVDDALRRFLRMTPGGVDGLDSQPDVSEERPDLTPFPPPDVFLSPWQFALADETPGDSARTSEPEPELVESAVAAATKCDDPDSRACRSGLNGRSVMDVQPSGTEPASYPPKINGTAFTAPAVGIRISPTADVDEGGANLAPACQVAGAVPGQPSAWQAHDVQTWLARRIASGRGAPLVLTQAAFEDLLAAVGVARGRLVVKTPDVTKPVPFAIVGDWPTTVPFPDLELIRTEYNPDRIVTTARLTGGGAAGAEFQALDCIPLTPGQALVAEAGMTVLSTWLSGVTGVAAGRLAEPVGNVPPAPIQDETIRGDVERAKRLSLKGGVLVAKFSNGGPPGAWAVTSVIEAMRQELRSSDLLGQLPTGEITALLMRANADRVAWVAWRVRERLEELAREYRLPPIELSHALYPDDGVESLSALAERARSDVTCHSEPLVRG